MTEIREFVFYQRPAPSKMWICSITKRPLTNSVVKCSCFYDIPEEGHAHAIDWWLTEGQEDNGIFLLFCFLCSKYIKKATPKSDMNLCLYYLRMNEGQAQHYWLHTQKRKAKLIYVKLWFRKEGHTQEECGFPFYGKATNFQVCLGDPCHFMFSSSTRMTWI